MQAGKGMGGAAPAARQPGAGSSDRYRTTSLSSNTKILYMADVPVRRAEFVSVQLLMLCNIILSFRLDCAGVIQKG